MIGETTLHKSNCRWGTKVVDARHPVVPVEQDPLGDGLLLLRAGHAGGAEKEKGGKGDLDLHFSCSLSS
jgi:hypothetical protein